MTDKEFYGFMILSCSFGMICGLFYAGTTGFPAGILFTFLAILAGLGLLYDKAELEEEEETQEDEEINIFQNGYLSILVRIMLDVMPIPFVGWGIMCFVEFYFDYKFREESWLFPLLLSIALALWIIFYEYMQSRWATNEMAGFLQQAQVSLLHFVVGIAVIAAVGFLYLFWLGIQAWVFVLSDIWTRWLWPLFLAVNNA